MNNDLKMLNRKDSPFDLSPESISKAILCYLRDAIAEKGGITEDEAVEFWHYLGLESKNLLFMLEIKNPYLPLSEKEYSWSQVYGRNKQLDISDYMKKCIFRMNNILEQKQEEIIGRALDCIMQGFREKNDAAFVCCMLDPQRENSLLYLLREGEEADYSFLEDMNRKTFARIKDMDETARNERGGFLGNRERALDDLLETVDQFLNQRYEIYRSRALKNIYSHLLEIITSFVPVFPDGLCPEKWQTVFEELNVYQLFEEIYLESFRIEDFLTSDLLEEAKNRCQALILFENIENSEEVTSADAETKGIDYLSPL